MYRFLDDIPSGWIFIISAILMRITEGIGWAMCTTTTFSLLIQFFPAHVATAMVSLASIWLRDLVGYSVQDQTHQHMLYSLTHLFTGGLIYIHAGLYGGCHWSGICSRPSYWRSALYCSYMYRVNVGEACEKMSFLLNRFMVSNCHSLL